MIRIGIDLGGTKMEGLALDLEGKELCRKRVPTPRGSYSEIIDALVALIGLIEQSAGEQGSIGIGIPGIASPATGLVKNANTTLLIGHPLDKDLEQRLGRPIRLANDANCFALSEATDGAASPAALGVGAPTVFGVILGTGTGAGVVVGGRVLVGPDAIDYSATLDDPQTFSRPWTMRFRLVRNPNPEQHLMEFKCVPFTEQLLYGDLYKQPRE